MSIFFLSVTTSPTLLLLQVWVPGHVNHSCSSPLASRDLNTEEHRWHSAGGGGGIETL